MKDGTTPRTFPYPEGSPDKPDWLARDPIACAEWDRICETLAARRALSPAWMGIIMVASSAYASFTSLMKAIETHGGIYGAEELLGSILSTYRGACMDCQVAPRPLATLRRVVEDETELEAT